MNNKPNYKKGTRREIIKMLHIGGILPVRSLTIFDTPRTFKDKLRDMKKEKVISDYRVKNGRKTYRFYALNDYERNKKKYIDSLPGGYYETYVTYNNDLANICRNKPGMRSMRILASAEMYIFMKEAGAACEPDTKINLYSKAPIDNVGASYYESREIKNYTGYKSEVKYQERTDTIGNESIKKVVSSRLAGLVVSDGGIYATYNLLGGLQNWQKGGELRMKAHLNKLLGDKMANPGEAESCMLLAENMKAYAPLLLSQDTKIKNSIESLKIAYANIYALPYTKDGRKLAEMMLRPDWINFIKNTCLYGYNTQDLNLQSVICDGYNDQEFALVFCVPNVVRLDRFISTAEADGNKDRFNVICFDFQLELVAPCCKGICNISTVSFNEIYRLFKKA